MSLNKKSVNIKIEYGDCYYSGELEYVLTKKECEDKTKYYINFIYPIKLQATTESKTVFGNLEKENIKEITDKWKSAIKAKYNSKLIDSFNTKFKLFVFYKFLCDKEFDKYFGDDFGDIVSDFQKFEITQDLADVFSSHYYQKNEVEEVIYGIYKKTVKDITEKLFDCNCNNESEYEKIYAFDMVKDDYRKKYKDNQTEIPNKNLYDDLKKKYLEENNFSLCDFINLISITTCEYCGISIEQIEKLGENGKLHNKRSETRGYSLEIDRKSANLEYSKENCCMSCYWCNNAKTDEFSEAEFKYAAWGINKIWNKRLKEIEPSSSVDFPWKDILNKE